MARSARGASTSLTARMSAPPAGPSWRTWWHGGGSRAGRSAGPGHRPSIGCHRHSHGPASWWPPQAPWHACSEQHLISNSRRNKIVPTKRKKYIISICPRTPQNPARMLDGSRR
jgi:hypothetical protein